MKPSLRKLCVSLLLLLLAGCAAKQADLPEYTYQENAIQINLRADAKLHWHEGTPHTLMVCVYQLRDLNSFNYLSSTKEGLYQLLECRNSDASIVTSNREFIQPGDNTLLTYDRSEDTRNVGLVAGYYDMREENMIRKAKIPVVKEIKGFFTRKEIAKPSQLTMDVTLGPYGIISR